MKTHRLIHHVNNPYSPREQVVRCLIHDVNKISMTYSPREQVVHLFDRCLIHHVNTLKVLPDRDTVSLDPDFLLYGSESPALSEFGLMQNCPNGRILPGHVIHLRGKNERANNATNQPADRNLDQGHRLHSPRRRPCHCSRAGGRRRGEKTSFERSTSSRTASPDGRTLRVNADALGYRKAACPTQGGDNFIAASGDHEDRGN